jgi:hypothetical protein
MDVSPSTEAAISLETQKETLAQYQGLLLPASSPVSRRVREVARRVVESNGLGRMKPVTAHGLGGGEGGVFVLPGLGEIFMGGGEGSWNSGDSAVELKTGKDVEWEVRNGVDGLARAFS